MKTIRTRLLRAARLLAPACFLVFAGGAAHRPIHVLSTISTLNAFVIAVGGANVVASSLVPIGAGPEDYQPTPSDIVRLHDADVLIENGAGLETWLRRTVDNASNLRLRIVTLSDGLPKKGNNPHLWMDPVAARAYVLKIRDALCSADRASCPMYTRNAAAYNRILHETERQIAAEIATIPPRRRAMITFHNAWQYYNDRFGLRTIGVVELSPGQEPNPKQIGDLIMLAKRERVPAIFGEPEYSSKLVRMLAENAGISVVETLFDDSLSRDERAKDYQTMLRYDTRVIVKALGGHAP